MKPFVKILYFAYSCLNSYLSVKYTIVENDYKSFPSENYPGIPTKNVYFLSKWLMNLLKEWVILIFPRILKKLKQIRKI